MPAHEIAARENRFGRYWRPARRAGHRLAQHAASGTSVGLGHNARVHKSLSGEIIATLSLTNMGLQPFSLITIGNVVAMVRDKDRAAGPVAQVVYQPGLLSAQARRLDIVLPGGTQSWHATLSIFEPGARVRARSWLEKHWFRKGILYSLTQLLPPNRFGLTAKVVTPTFQVPAELASP